MNNATFVYAYSTLPTEWRVQELTSGICAVGQSRHEALAQFKAVWANRAPVSIVDSAPPTRRLGEQQAADPPLPTQPVVIPVAVVYRDLMEQHSRISVDDGAFTKHGRYMPRFTFEQVQAALTKLWDATQDFTPAALPVGPAPKADDAGAHAFNKLMRQFHSDRHPGKSFTGDEVVAALVELRDAMRIA